MQRYLSEPRVTNLSNDELALNIRKYFLIDYFRTTDLIRRLINSLMLNASFEILELINSDDSESSKVGIQLLFIEHIDTYNLVNNSKIYDNCLYIYPKYLLKRNYAKHCR